MWGCPTAEVVVLRWEAVLWGCPIAEVVGLPHSGGCGAEMWGRPIAEVVGLRCGPAP